MGRASTTTEHRVTERLRAMQVDWAAERRAALDEARAVRQGLSLPARIAAGVAVRDLFVEEEDAAPGDRLLLWLRSGKHNEIEWFRGGPGDPVRLWRQDPDERDCVLGVLSRRRGDRLGVMVSAGAAEQLDEPGFRLDVDAPQATFDRADKVLQRLLASGGEPAWRALRAALLGGEAVEVGSEEPEAFFDAALNAPQRAAVSLALGSPHLSLVHGPPGTGKTRTLVEVIRQLVARGARVLATGASNAAVDNLAVRLGLAGVRLVRLGHPARVDAAVEAHTLDSLSERSPEVRLAREWIAEANALRRKVLARGERGALSRAERREQLREVHRLQADARKYLERVQRAMLASAEVVCATAAGADTALLSDAAFDAVVLDEATQSVDPISLVALTRAPRAILAGDPCQLPPTVLAQRAAPELARTFFERVAERQPAAVSLLRVQHRMHAAIMAFPSASMYQGALECASAVATHDLEGIGVASDELRPGALVFVDTAGKGWEEERDDADPSTRNRGQAERVAAEVRRLLSRGIPSTECAVITPYYAQVRLLREALAPETAQGLEVGSVDGFQGREKEAIVVDLVRSNEHGEIGFLRDVRRMNVALTRARRFLLVVGDSATLGEHGYYEAFLRHVEAEGAYVSAWTDDALLV